MSAEERAAAERARLAGDEKTASGGLSSVLDPAESAPEVKAERFSYEEDKERLENALKDLDKGLAREHEKLETETDKGKREEIANEIRELTEHKKKVTRNLAAYRKLLHGGDDHIKPLVFTREPFFPQSFGPLFPFDATNPRLRKKKIPGHVQEAPDIESTVQTMRNRIGKPPGEDHEKLEEAALRQALKAVVTAAH